MSWRASAWALDQVRGIGANAKLVLLALCEFANDENKTWRSQSEIAKRSECELRTVKAHLKSLEEWGLIDRKPLYRWCDSDSEKCAARPSHKHRSGTVYRVNLEIGEFDLAVAESEPNSTLPVDNSTSVKIAPVEKSAECSGKVHKCKNCTCEDGSKSTSANSRSPQVQELAPICNSKPPYKPPTNQSGSESSISAGGGLVGENDSSAVKAGADPSGLALPREPAPAPPSAGEVLGVADGELIARCVPRGRMRNVLTGKAGVRVAKALRAAIEAGWREGEILWRLDNNPAPASPRNLAGLVIHRVEEIASSPSPSALPGATGGSHSTTGLGQKADLERAAALAKAAASRAEFLASEAERRERLRKARAEEERKRSA